MEEPKMKRLELRKKSINNSYKFENYDEIKKEIEEIYRENVAKVFIEYLISNDKKLENMTSEEKKNLFTEIITAQGAVDVKSEEIDSSISFVFMVKPEKNKTKNPVKVNLIIENA